MIQTAGSDEGGMECADFDSVVSAAFAASGAEGVLVLEVDGPLTQPAEALSGLMGSLLYLLAPESPRQLKLFTYDAMDRACLEIRGARSVSGLPAALVDAARALGGKIHLVRTADSSSVLLTLPSELEAVARAA